MFTIPMTLFSGGMARVPGNYKPTAYRAYGAASQYTSQQYAYDTASYPDSTTCATALTSSATPNKGQVYSGFPPNYAVNPVLHINHSGSAGNGGSSRGVVSVEVYDNSTLSTWFASWEQDGTSSDTGATAFALTVTDIPIPFSGDISTLAVVVSCSSSLTSLDLNNASNHKIYDMYITVT